MTYIDLKNNDPGILGLFKYDPKIAETMTQLAHQALTESVFPQQTAELIAAYVSYQNKCEFCFRSHLEAFKASLGEISSENVSKYAQSLIAGTLTNEVDVWLRSLLMLSDQVRLNVKPTQEMIDYCKLNGVVDKEIYSTVLITSVFSMFNRYVDGFNTTPCDNIEQYETMGKRMAENGYKK